MNGASASRSMARNEMCHLGANLGARLRQRRTHWLPSSQSRGHSPADGKIQMWGSSISDPSSTLRTLPSILSTACRREMQDELRSEAVCACGPPFACRTHGESPTVPNGWHSMHAASRICLAPSFSLTFRGLGCSKHNGAMER